MRRLVSLIVLFNAFLLTALDLHKLDNFCRNLQRNEGEFALMITNPQKGKILFEYNRTMLYNRSFCPGSLLKPYVLVAIAKSGPIDPDRKFFCRGFFDPQGKNCWLGPGHGELGLIDALSFSCNLYFEDLAKEKLTRTDYFNTLYEFGLIRPAVFDLTDEDFYKQSYGLGTRIKVKPAGMMFAYNALFNGGILYDKSGSIKRNIAVSDDLIEIIREGMKKGYLIGTSKEVLEKADFSDIFAKTGTGAAFNDEEYDSTQNVGWIVLFSPLYTPNFSMLVFKDKTKGSSRACLLAAKVLSFLKKSGD